MHVKRRARLLTRARRRLLGVVAQLPAWMTVRSIVRLVAWVSRPLGEWVARWLPVSVPGVSPGATPLAPGGSVAVIGGGIAGCSAAWALARAGYKVTLFEARQQVSGNARTFDWDGFSDGRTVKSCVSVTAWPPVLYKVGLYVSLCVNLAARGRESRCSRALAMAAPGGGAGVRSSRVQHQARGREFHACRSRRHVS